MVKLNKIYTRTGDAGESGLVDGSRRRKSDLRFETCGDVDETNAAIGIARLYVAAEYDAILACIQQDLFDLGADFATPHVVGQEHALRINEAQVARLESEIDALNSTLAALESFILPGGSTASAHIHLARTVARRAERVAVALAEREMVNPIALQYLNRLSDILFVLARATNDQGKKDVLWKPGVNR